jgi:hypothetical protein
VPISCRAAAICSSRKASVDAAKNIALERLSDPSAPNVTGLDAEFVLQQATRPHVGGQLVLGQADALAFRSAALRMRSRRT